MGSSQSNRPLSLDSNLRPTSMEGGTLLDRPRRTDVREESMRTSSSLMQLSGDLFGDKKTDEDDFYPLRSNTTNDKVEMRYTE